MNSKCSIPEVVFVVMLTTKYTVFEEEEFISRNAWKFLNLKCCPCDYREFP